jgi:hypothetical protein
MALLVRLHHLQQVSDWHYRRLCVDFAPYRTTEPEPIARESSQVLGKVFKALEKDGVQKKDVAKAMHLHLGDLEEFVFGLASLPAPPELQASSGRAALRLVE